MKISILSLVLLLTFSSFYGQVATNPEGIKPLLKGENIPYEAVASPKGESISLLNIVQKQKTVLIFYRGGWCPYCNTHLSAIGALQKEIKSLGYQTVAISPDAPEELKKSIDRNKLDYQLYSDSNTTLIQKMGIAIQAPDRYTNKLLDYSDQKNSNVIPVPSVFIVSKKGEILYQYSDGNYKNRISEEELLNALKENQ